VTVLSTVAAPKVAVRLAHLALEPWVREGFIRRGLGPLRRWTAGRDFPAVPPRSFRTLWRRDTDAT
jgi:L-lactate dehydrogenase complex protein LldF